MEWIKDFLKLKFSVPGVLIGGSVWVLLYFTKYFPKDNLIALTFFLIFTIVGISIIHVSMTILKIFIYLLDQIYKLVVILTLDNETKSLLCFAKFNQGPIAIQNSKNKIEINKLIKSKIITLIGFTDIHSTYQINARYWRIVVLFVKAKQI